MLFSVVAPNRLPWRATQSPRCLQAAAERGSERASSSFAGHVPVAFSGAIKAHPGTGSQGGSQFSVIHQLHSCCLGGRGPEKTASSPGQRASEPHKSGRAAVGPWHCLQLIKGLAAPQGWSATCPDLCWEGAGRLETWGENQAFGVRWAGFTPPASSTV